VTTGADALRISSFACNVSAANSVQLVWNSQPTRFYAVQYRSALDSSSTWTDCGTFTSPGVSSTGFYDSNDQRFYRIRAYRPLQP
jgi:hypothetical protein